MRWLGWNGLPNGELLDRADAAGYSFIVTGDQGMEGQQNWTRRRIAPIFIDQDNASSPSQIRDIREQIRGYRQ